MKFSLNPKAKFFKVALDVCSCDNIKDCAFKAVISNLGAYGGLIVNGVTVVRDTPPSDLVAAIIEDLEQAGGMDVFAKDFTYEDGVLSYNDASQLIPTFIINGEEIPAIEYCESRCVCSQKLTFVPPDRFPFNTTYTGANGVEIYNEIPALSGSAREELIPDLIAYFDGLDGVTVNSIEFVEGANIFLNAYIFDLALDEGVKLEIGGRELGEEVCEIVWEGGVLPEPKTCDVQGVIPTDRREPILVTYTTADGVTSALFVPSTLGNATNLGATNLAAHFNSIEGISDAVVTANLFSNNYNASFTITGENITSVTASSMTFDLTCSDARNREEKPTNEKK